MNGPDKARCVHEMFERQTSATPDAPAVSCGDATWSYARLNATANRFARRIRAAGAAHGDRIGIYGFRSAERIAMMLAVAKAGASYVPLEGTLPIARLRTVAELAAVEIVVCRPGEIWAGPQRVLTLDDGDPETARQPGTDLGLRVRPDEVFYLPFTSGSTGRPKGVEVTHRSVPGFFRPADYARWGPGHVWAQHMSTSWDGAVLEIYPSLLSGGHVVVVPDAITDPVEVVEQARRHGANAMVLTTQAFNTVVDIGVDTLRGLRQMVIGGEKASPRHIATALTTVPGLTVVNIYGPVECTVLATAHRITAGPVADTPVPLGPQVGDRRVEVRDHTGRRVPDGTVGELCVSGPGVGRGYLGNPRMTAERFVPDPDGEPGARSYRTGDLGHRDPDGLFHFHGRRDGQVKIRGFRIEVGEVEAELRRHPAVADAAVVIGHDHAGRPRLTAFVVTGGDLRPGELRGWLGERLPAAMVPEAVGSLTRLPLNSNGKLDRQALAETPVAHDRTDYEAPAGSTEKFLAALWQEQLGVADIGRRDDFFALGGHSLSGTRVLTRVRERFDARLSVRDLYDAPTLTGFAAVIDDARGTGGRVGTIPRLRRPARSTDNERPVEAETA